MNKLAVIPLLFAITMSLIACGNSTVTSAVSEISQITLPPPQKDSDTSIEEALLGRRSVREYSGAALTLEQVSQLCWAAQGITNSSGGRTAPSAGGLYPLKIYIVIGDVKDMVPGVYEYVSEGHVLNKILDGDIKQTLSQAALSQSCVEAAAMDIVITGDYNIVTPRYGDRAERYTHLEAGHAAQNICLQAVGLKLGTVTIGAFDDTAVRNALGLPDNETPMYILPVGSL